MKSLIDYKKNVCNIRDECVHIMKENCFDTLANSLKNDTDAIFKKNSPSIMFYGLYNAGKSSIINAIFGKEIASIGDIPTTREVQEIFWDNFIIVDTPGINANNEHTIVTEHEISKHDIILFVLDDMSIEEKSFYSAFLKVLKQNKPVLIVINKKNVEQDHSNIDKLKNRIIENIRTEGTDKNINNIENYKNFYGIITVNALIGYNAKICKDVSSAEVLYNLSGLEDLTITMQKVLNNSNGVKQLLPAIDIIESSITKCNQSLTNRLQSNAQKNYTNSFERVKRQENNLYKRLINEGKNQIRIFSDSISKNI